MKKLFTLIALCLGMSTGALAETETSTILNIDYSVVSTPAWTVTGGSGSITDAAWVHAQGGGSGSRSAYINLGVAENIDDNYIVSYDFKATTGSTWTQSGDIQTAVVSDGASYASNNPQTSNVLFGVDCTVSRANMGNDLTYVVTLNGETDGNVVLSNNVVYTITVSVSDTELSASIYNGNTKVYSNTATLSEFVKPQGIFSCLPRPYNASWGVYSCVYDNIKVTKEVQAGVVEVPSGTITAVNGIKRIITFSCATDGVVYSYSTDNGENYTDVVGNELEIASTTTMIIKATKGDVSNVSESVTFEAGEEIKLNKPTITLTDFTENGGLYYPVYTFTSNQSDVDFTPSVTYSYTFAGGDVTDGTSYTATSTAGKLVVTVSANGYASASQDIDITGVSYVSSYFFNAETLSAEDHLETTSGNNSTLNGAGCCFYNMASDAIEGLTLTGCQLAWKITANQPLALYFRTNKGTISYDGAFPEGSYINLTTFDNVKSVSNSSTNNFNTYGSAKTLRVLIPSTPVPVTISDAGYATFVAPCDVDFTDNAIEAYYVSDVNAGAGTVTLTKVNQVPAGEAVIVKGESGNVNVIASAEAISNLMQVATEAIVYDENAAQINYVLAQGANGVGLYPVTSGTIVAGKGYLPVLKSAAAKDGFTFVTDDVTAANVVKAAPAAVKNGKFATADGIVIVKDGVKYNVAGMKK